MGDSASKIGEKLKKKPSFINKILKKRGYIEGSSGNYKITDKGRQHGIVKGRSYFLWDEHVVKEITRRQFFYSLAVKFGHLINYTEEIAFIGFVSFWVFTLVLKINPGFLIKTAQGRLSHDMCCSVFVLSSLLAYPLLIIVSWLYQKALKFFDDDYERIPLISLIGITICRDAIFPFGLLFTRNENISKHLILALFVKLVYFLVLWVVPVAFVFIGAMGLR